ncbi:hypothetical protein M9H77_22701 [Catharanthus roseus]|uniref:Uncharacterized protein n=1 Tax=Catharanthus roseus TaxID=4058 RepID=A0ACC0ATW0_CATRO|nr:hypothetical protein M9H77_22701 [Catharanthus roseus]
MWEEEKWYSNPERFPTQRKSKLDDRGDGPFQILEKINDNAYKVDLLGHYNVSTTFNVSDLSLFDIGDGDSRTNPFQEGEDDVNWFDMQEHQGVVQEPRKRVTWSKFSKRSFKG